MITQPCTVFDEVWCGVSLNIKYQSSKFNFEIGHLEFDIQLAFDIGTLTLFGYWLLDIPKWIDLFFRVSVQQ